MIDALYARQSVERADSISIESQLEYCRYEAHGRPATPYIDRGYSGKNTHRPAFEQMLADVRAGKIARVIVYKLDRISRSILDFANMMDVFARYRVEFVSSTERFDTSTPIGRAMLHICIVFAQLERETIQKRVADAYYSRCRRGLYMGGRIPYGFAKTEATIDGIRTSMFVPIPEEAEQIRLMYELYADPGNTLTDVARYFRDHGIHHLRGGTWNTARLSEMLHNPIYVRADEDVYRFFESQGAHIVNPPADFTGENACYLYRGSAEQTGGANDLTEKEVVLAPHAGIVSAHDWIACRMRCLHVRPGTRRRGEGGSWLTGSVRCGRCGTPLRFARSSSRRQRYFFCSARDPSGERCSGVGGTVYADVLEDCVWRAVRARLMELAFDAASVRRLEYTDFATKRAVASLMLEKISMADGVITLYWRL